MAIIVKLNNGETIDLGESLLKNNSSLSQGIQQLQDHKNNGWKVVVPETDQEINFKEVKSIEIVFK